VEPRVLPPNSAQRARGRPCILALSSDCSTLPLWPQRSRRRGKCRSYEHEGQSYATRAPTDSALRSKARARSSLRPGAASCDTRSLKVRLARGRAAQRTGRPHERLRLDLPCLVGLQTATHLTSWKFLDVIAALVRYPAWHSRTSASVLTRAARAITRVDAVPSRTRCEPASFAADDARQVTVRSLGDDVHASRRGTVRTYGAAGVSSTSSRLE